MEASLEEQIAELALSTFDNLPRRCKPRTYPDGRREWTPVSAIVIASYTPSKEGHNPTRELKCISLATGTKCLPASAIPHCQGSVLHDCHAEVLAFRGLNWWLLDECQRILQKEKYRSPYLTFERSTLGDRDATNTSVGSSSPLNGCRPFQIRSTTVIYLFSSTAPCGDASMEIVAAGQADATPWSTDTLNMALEAGTPLGRGHFDHLGAVRRKPARGDAEATLSKSCSDKMAVKQFTSVLSFPVDLFVDTTQAAFLKGLVVFHDQYNQVSYDRCFQPNGRLKALSEFEMERHFFDTLVLPRGFRRFAYEKVHDSKSTNLSAVWVAAQTIPEGCAAIGGIIEVLVNGVKQGYKQWDIRPGKSSMLCRRKMMEKAQTIETLLHETYGTGLFSEPAWSKSYRDSKHIPERYGRALLKQKVLSVLKGWESNSAEDNFTK